MDNEYEKVKNSKILKKINILLGPPCSGKGSCVSLLNKNYGYKKISASHILKEKFPISEEEKKAVNNGILVNNNLFNQYIVDALEENCFLEGFPRDNNQANYIKQYLSKDSNIFVLNINYNKLLQRMYNRFVCTICGENFNYKGNCCNILAEKRIDDVEPIFEKRWNIFADNIYKVLEVFYEFPIRFINSDNLLNNLVENIHKNI